MQCRRKRTQIPPFHTPLSPPSILFGLKFAQVLFSLEGYLLSPFMRRYIRRASPIAHVLATAALVAAATALLLPLSPALTSLFYGSIVFISFVCPRCAGLWSSASYNLVRFVNSSILLGG